MTALCWLNWQAMGKRWWTQWFCLWGCCWYWAYRYYWYCRGKTGRHRTLWWSVCCEWLSGEIPECGYCRDGSYGSWGWSPCKHAHLSKAGWSMAGGWQRLGTNTWVSQSMSNRTWVYINLIPSSIYWFLRYWYFFLDRHFGGSALFISDT